MIIKDLFIEVIPEKIKVEYNGIERDRKKEVKIKSKKITKKKYKKK